MSKKKISTILFFYWFLYAPAQQFEWAVQIGGWSLWNWGQYIMNDSLENVFVQGKYEHYLDGYPYGAFSSKFDESGTAVFIAKTDSFHYNYRVVGLDENGFYYIYGYFRPPYLKLGNFTVSNNGAGGLFIAKLASIDENLSDCVWGKLLNQPASRYVDKKGNLFLSGGYISDTYGPVIIDNDTLYGEGGYIAKINTDGNCEWLKNIGDHGAYNITTDNTCNIIISGELMDFRSITIGTGPNSVTFDSISGSFLAQFDTAGNIKWAKNVDWINGIGTDNYNNIYFTGVVGYQSINYGKGEIFLSKFDEAGNFLWNKFVQADTYYSSNSKDIVIDKNDNIYIGGTIGEIAVFDTITVTNFNPSANMFVAKYDTAGDVKWVANAEALSWSGSFGNSICTDGKGNIWVTGWFHDSVKFGNTKLTVPYQCNDDVFIAKIIDTSGIFSLTTQKEKIKKSPFSLYPNPARNSLTISHSENASSLNFEIKNLTGKTILSSLVHQRFIVGEKSPSLNDMGLCTIDISNLSPGFYFIEVVAGEMREVEKFVVVR